MGKYSKALGYIGAKGGRKRTRAKREAARRNLVVARKHLRSRRLCRVCKKNRLGVRNRSGVCRECRRSSKLKVESRKSKRK